MLISNNIRTAALRGIILASLPAICLGLPGCRKAADETPQPLVTVEAEHPELGEISEHIIADATLAPLAQAAISPKITAPVHKFYVQRGSSVKQGQLLAELESRDLSAQALDNQGQYAAAQATYKMQTEAQVPDDSIRAQADTAQAKAQLQLQQQIVASRKSLFDQGAISGRDYDTAVAGLAQAQAAYDTAQTHLASLSRVSRQASLDAAEGQLSSAKAKLQAAEAQVSYAEIHSPISGVVTDRPLFAGETASSGAPLITVMDTSSLLAKVHLAQIVAQRLSLGDAASIIVPGVEEPVTGKVSLISPAVDPGSTTVEVWLKVANPGATLKAGTPVRVSITGQTAAKALKVPLTAVITSEDGAKSLMVVGSDSIAHKVSVQLGVNDGEDIAVTKGVSSSSMVITKGAYGLSDGTRVTVGKAAADGDDK